MKTSIKVTFFVLLFTVLASCDALNDLTNVEFDTDLSTDLNINVNDALAKSTIDSYSFSAMATLDPLSDPDVEEYADKIEDYDVNSLTATVLSVSKPDVKLLAGTFFKVYDSTDSAKWTLDADFDVVPEAEYLLDNTAGNWDKVRQILKRNAVFTVLTEGESSTNNVSIVIELSIGATVTANPL